MYHRDHGYSALRRGRVSIPHATYFLTLCVSNGGSDWVLPDVVQVLHSTLADMDRDGTLTLRAVTVMPDHLHLLARLGERLSISQAIGRFKMKTRGALAGVGMFWQANMFEHRLRPNEPVLPVLHYIFMNPYGQGLIGGGEKWPGFRCGDEDWAWFQHRLHDECPYPEWLIP